MSYQVLARKWRPQRFDDVIGQQAVTRTLRNAITSGRIAQAFVFAGQRGSGKTTTARILARALSCVKGPTPDPCGVCDACVEIAQGRDIDVLEIDAASHTGIDNIREVIIDGLSIAPVRDRYKVFIIDEVHQLSGSSFNALLKSIEEPPAHVVFMMATTELHKIPDTILSRSQVFEFRTIPAALIAAQLRTIAAAEGVTVSDSALGLMARAAEGSMRDAQSAFDQVIAFAGTTITSEDVATVLGLVGRDLLFGLLDAVVAEDAPAAFAFADRAVEAGSDLRIVCRELARVVRDLMIVSVDPSRASEVEMGEGERERLGQLAARFSREDLMRAFDLLSKLDFELRQASYPRYQFEMALLKWMHLRKLVPLAELLEQAGPSAAAAPKMPVLSKPAQTLQAPRAPLPTARVQPLAPKATANLNPQNPTPPNPESRIPNPGTSSAGLKDALLAEIRAKKGLFYNTVVAQAQKIEVASDRVTFAFLPTHRALREQLEVTRPWLEAAAARIAGRPVAVVAVQLDGPSAPPVAVEPDEPRAEPNAPAEMPKDRRNLKAEAMSSTTVQAMLDVFPAEIRDVEEL